MKRLLVVMVLLAALLLFFLQGAHWLTLDSLRLQLSTLEAWRAQAPLGFAVAFAGAYALAAALSVPGAVLFTLAAGALFGLVGGTVVASIASSVGALGAFLTSRYLLRDLVQRRFGSNLKPMNEGIEKDGGFYLFSLRLVPLFPFFLVNLLMGLTPLPARTFFFVSQIGMLAGTIVYVNAGRQLATLQGLSGILSPGVAGSFVFLAVFPWIARLTVDRWRRRRIYSRWRRPASFDRNLVVVGAGAAGLVTSYIAATVRAKVTLVEGHRMGGDCLNTGCVPSKALIRSARLAHQMRHADQFGLEPVDPVIAFGQVMKRVQTVIRAIEPHDSVERYTKLGVEVLQGHARLVDPWTVEISAADRGVRRITTRSIVIATGAEPVVPDLPGIEASGYLTSDTLWDWLATQERAPQRVIVLGGGPIGTELSQALQRLGSTVTQVERNERILVREDPEVSALVTAALADEHIAVLTNTRALRCEVSGAGKHLVVERDGQEQSIAFDVLVCAVGRAARLTGYGLEELGIPTGRTLDTNAWLETRYPNILAAGDVAGPYQFTHAAAHQAWYAAVNALFGQWKRFKVDYRVMPWTTFSDPEVARVGLNEQEAREKGIPHEVTRYGLDDLDRAIADSATQGFVKVLTEPGRDRILGVTIVGEHAGELLAEFVLAMKWKLGLKRVLSTIHVYPTMAEANKYAAGNWRRAHAPEGLLRWVERYHRWRRRGSAQ